MQGVFEPGLTTRDEWRWAWGGALAVAVLACIPYLYAWLAAPPERVFGGFLINPADGNSYLAKMRQGYEGEWLFRLPFTPEDQHGIFVFTLYLGLGHLARLTGLPLAFVFHLARFISGLFLLVSIYRLAAELTPDRAARRWAFAIAAFGSGLALVSLLIGREDGEAFVPVDLYVPEAIGFYSILSNPHFCLAFTFQAWAIIWALNPPRRLKGWTQMAIGVLIGLGLTSLAPYLAPVVWVTVGVGVAVSRPPTRETVSRVGIMFGGMALFLLYVAWAMRSDLAIAEWARQNVTPSPPALDVLLGLGVWLPLAAVGGWQLYRARGLTPTLAALVAWLLLTAGLIYFPYPLQRRFLGGAFVPLSALAGVGVTWLLSKTGRAKVMALAGILLFGFSANALVLVALLVAPRAADPKIYLTNDEAAALRWLESQVALPDVVLADTRLGLFVPGWTGARTVYGHPMETLQAEVKRAEVEAFYAGDPDQTLLDRYQVKYILGGAVPEGWRVVFESGPVKVYGR